MLMSSIFIQIASYRDLELVPTIADCLKKASGKHSLTFGVVWQRGPEETLGGYENNPNIRVIDIPWAQSKGLGWARSLTQSLYKGEDYTLQLDSHHRFSQNWDDDLISMLKLTQTVSDKPILTAYAAGYDPANDSVLTPNACKILPHDFKLSGTIWFNPVSIMDNNLLMFPINARLVSGHYFFTLGQHCTEYVYDPDIYFAGDEISLSVRSYTMGYDLYHPHKCFVWHHYGRNDRIKHWGDHNQTEKEAGIIEQTWGERDIYSKKRIRQLLGEEDNNIDLGIYGLGNIRTLQEYETYAGFDFKKKRIQKSSIEGVNPPVKFDSPVDYENGFKKTTPIRLPKWPINDYMAFGESLDYVTIDFMNLRRETIHRDTLYRNQLMNMIHTLYQTIVCGDYYPMKVVLTAMGGDKILHKWEKDLRENIHWD